MGQRDDPDKTKVIPSDRKALIIVPTVNTE